MPDGGPRDTRRAAGARRHDAASLAGQSSPATESAGHSVPLGHDDRHSGPYTTGPAARASRLASLACLWLSGAGLCVITLIILYQVFMRYVLSASPAWSEQLALYVLVWTVLVAAAAGVREQFHIRIQAGQDALSPKRRKIALHAAHLVTAMIGVFLAIYGFQLVGALWGYDIPTLGLPRGSAFLPLPLGGILIAAFSLEHVLALAKGKEVRPLWR